MRFVEWNCCGALERDLPLLLKLEVDIAVFCEVPQTAPEPTLFRPPVDWLWTGLPSSEKGLALASFGEPFAQRHEREGAGSLAVAAETADGIGVLGIWTWPQGGNYGPSLRATIEAYASWLASTPSILAGDFNISPNGPEDSRSRALAETFGRLSALGYRSAYHHHFREDYGRESNPTYFHKRMRDQPHHIDYCFIHDSLLSRTSWVEVGGFERWVDRVEGKPGASDHVPLVVDIG